MIETGVEDFLNFELFKSIDLNRRGRLLALARYGVSCGGAEQADMEHGVDLYCRWQVELVGVRAHGSLNRKRAKVPLVELLLRA